MHRIILCMGWPGGRPTTYRLLEVGGVEELSASSDFRQQSHERFGLVGRHRSDLAKQIHGSVGHFPVLFRPGEAMVHAPGARLVLARLEFRGQRPAREPHGPFVQGRVVVADFPHLRHAKLGRFVGVDLRKPFRVVFLFLLVSISTNLSILSKPPSISDFPGTSFSEEQQGNNFKYLGLM